VLHIISPEIGPAGPLLPDRRFFFEGAAELLKDQRPSPGKRFIAISLRLAWLGTTDRRSHIDVI
jgi:hypothetical protein